MRRVTLTQQYCLEEACAFVENVFVVCECFLLEFRNIEIPKNNF